MPFELRQVAAMLLLFSLCATNASADIVFAFSDSNDFEGDGVGDTVSFVDPLTSVSVTLTTRGLTGVPGSDDSLAVLNPNGSGTSGTLGINSDGADTTAAFDAGESWTFDFDVETSFLAVDFGSFTTSNAERFTATSSDWIGLSLMMPSASVFDSGSGTITFTDNGTFDIFSLAGVNGGDDLTLNAGSDLTLAYLNDSTGSAVIQSLTFSTTAVPEPSSLVIFGLCSVIHVFRRRRAVL